MFRPAFLCLAAPLAFAQQYPILDLQAMGSERYKPAEIIAATRLKTDISRRVALQTIRSAAQKLVDSGVFSDVGYRHSAATGGMSVQFTVKDKAADQFLPVRFENIVWFPDRELRSQIAKQLPLFHGDVPLDGHLAEEIASAVSGLLKPLGVDAHVSSSQSCLINDTDCVRRFAIDNLQILTRQLSLEGASREIDLEVQRAATPGIRDKPYLKSTTDKEVEQIIRAACLRRGLLRAEIGPVSAKVVAQSGDEIAVALHATLNAGVAYKFEGQEWSGNHAIPSATLEKMLHLYQHLPVDGAQLEADLQQVRAQYATHGYIRIQLSPQPGFDQGTDTVRYKFTVDEGPLFRMGKIDVSGFPDKVVNEVTTLFKLREGDPFDRSYVDRFFREDRVKRLFEGRRFVVEESEGETESAIDMSIILCHPSGCKPSPAAIFTSGARD